VESPEDTRQADPSGGTSRPDDEQPESTESTTAAPTATSESEDLGLAPIPAEGTIAPADPERVFGRQPSPSAYSRVIAAADRPPKSDHAGRPTPAGDQPAPGPSAGPETSDSSTRGEQPATTPRPHDAPGAGHPASPPPPSSPPSPQDVSRLTSRGRLAIFLGLAGLVCVTSVFALPLGLGLGIAAIVVGARARKRGQQAHQAVPGAMTGIVLGIVSSVFASLLIVSAAVFWEELVEYQDCVSGANTNTAREACQREFEERLVERVTPPPR